MKEVSRVDLGSVKVHKRVLAEIVQSAIAEIKGVQLIPRDFLVTAGEFFGFKRFPGISVSVDKNNQVTIEVRVLIQYGLNIPDMAKQAQDAIREAVEKTVDIDLKEIHVNIQGIMKVGP